MAPLAFLTTSTLTAGVMSVRDNFWPMATGPNAALHVQGLIQSVLTVVMMVLCVIILVSAGQRWIAVLSGRVVPVPDLVEAKV